MNKDDILAKSRKENKNGDEREEKIKLRSDAISATVGGILCLIFLVLEGFVFDRSTALIWIIPTGMLFSKHLLDAIKLKKGKDIFSSIVWGLLCTIRIMDYISENWVDLWNLL